jgi:dual specificity phosphatase 12
MSYLLQGSTAHTGMGWLDLVPHAGNLYIGGLYALYQISLIEEAGITHVLSVIDNDPLLPEKFGHLEHLHIRAEDDPNENLLQYFDDAVRWIDSALGEDGKRGVFVHCAMGKSRSATLVCAYLIWKFQSSAAEALEQLCEGRPVCAPNPGFAEQLVVWADMCAVDWNPDRKGVEKEREKKREERKIYEHWATNRFTGEVWEWEKLHRQKKDENKVYSKL